MGKAGNTAKWNLTNTTREAKLRTHTRQEPITKQEVTNTETRTKKPNRDMTG